MNKAFRFIAKYFLQGLLYITPISVTIYALYWVFMHLDNVFKFNYPGIGILILIGAVTVIGIIGSLLIQLPIFGMIDKRLEKAPLIKLIYSSMKDLVSAFVGNKKNFNKPVLVKLYENSEIRRLGFITDDAKDMLNTDAEYITVYVPHSFAISGQLYLLPPSYIEEVKGKSAEIMKYIVAGGIAKLDDLEEDSSKD